jgi:hypothetical protein
MQQPMPIIVGAPRSGTTLLRFMLDAHPELALPPETGFFSLEMNHTEPSCSEFFEAIINFPADAPGWQDFHIPKDQFWARLETIEPFTLAAGYRTFYQLYAERFGKRRWGDKAPLHCFFMDRIEAVLPEAHFIHILRDGRDVCMSLRHMWFSPGWDVEIQARHWLDFVSAARDHGARAQHYLEIKYEELIARPDAVLRRICAFLQLPYVEAMLRYHERTPDRLREHQTRLRLDGSVVITTEQRLRQQEWTMRPPDMRRILAWKSTMDPAERRRYEAVAGTLLAQLDYEVERD